MKFELRPDIWTQKYNFSLILLSESKVIKIIQLPKGPTWTTRESNLKLILTRTKCANQIFNVLTHYILLTHQYLDPPTPSGDPLGIDTSCQVLFLGIRTAGKVLSTGFQVLSGIGDPWIGHVWSPPFECVPFLNVSLFLLLLWIYPNPWIYPQSNYLYPNPESN